jgi:uncharacterized membrane protein
MNLRSRSLLVATLASVLAAPAVLRAEDPKTDEGQPCWGINKCKGLGDCGASGCRSSGCHGSNACNRKGFIRLQKETCLKINGGRLTKAAEKPAAKKSAETKG